MEEVSTPTEERKVDMGAPQGTEGVSPLECNLLHPVTISRRVMEQTMRKLMDPVVKSFDEKGLLTPQEFQIFKEMFCYSSGYRANFQGLGLVLLEITRRRDGGKITMEGILESKNSPIFLEMAQIIYAMPDTYHDGFNSLLVDFFALVENHRDGEEDWLALMDAPGQGHGQAYHDAWVATVNNCVYSVYGSDSKERMAAVEEEMQRRGITTWKKLTGVLPREMDDKVHGVLARDPLRGVTLMQFIEFYALVAEYNEEWAWASFEWGVVEL